MSWVCRRCPSPRRRSAPPTKTPRQLADALQRKGFLNVAADPSDARVRPLSTTGRNRDYWRRRSDADQQQVIGWFADLSTEEAQILFELLARVERRARAALSPAPGRAQRG